MHTFRTLDRQIGMVPAPVAVALGGIDRAQGREGALRELVMSDVHSPSQFRVNGPLPNIDAWYSAFNVQPGDKLFIKPEERVRIW